MAQRRMTSLDVIDTDAFLDMPVSSQLLYFHLNARADDDGFLANPKRIMRSTGTQDDDLKVLISKKFIVAFSDGVCVIKHWRINNFIRKDIYKETKYLNNKRTLLIRKNGVYTQTNDDDAIPVPNGHFQLDNINVNKALTSRQHSIVKGSIDKISKDKIAEETSASFSLKGEIEKLENNVRREMNVIALYFEERKPDLQTKAQYQIALKRHLRAAKQLIPFTDTQILSGVKKAKYQTPEWTLETVVKMLTK